MLKGSTTLVVLLSLFISVGSIGTYLNLYDSSWSSIGVDPHELKSSIQKFPKQKCDKVTAQLCERLAGGAIWFLGL